MARRVLTVVPDSERASAWLTVRSRDQAFVDARQVCTLAQLVERCEPARWAGRVPAAPLLAQLLVAGLAPQHALRAFGPAALEPDFAQQALELVAHLRAQAATPRVLRKAAAGTAGTLAARAGALASLWEALDAALDGRGLVDPGLLTALAARRLRAEGLPPALQDHGAFRVLDVTDLFPARLDFLEALAQACHSAGKGFELAWPSSGEPAADLFVLDAVRQVEARWQAWDAEAGPRVSEGPLAWLGAAAFQEAPVPAPAPGLQAFTAATPREEARQLAARVKALTAQGTPPERIGIAFRDLASDTEPLVEALAELGVPVRARLGVPLLASPPGRLALAVLELAEDGVPADGLASVLESGLVDALGPGAARPRAAFQAAGVRDDAWGAVAGRGGYAVRLAALARRTPRPAERRQVEALAAALAPRLEAVRAIPAEAPALELLEAWWDALSRLGLFRCLAQRPEPALDPALGWADALDRARGRDQAAGEALLALLGALKEALVASGLASSRMARASFVRLVRVAALDVNLMAGGPKAGAVWLLDARELPGLDFDALFVGGLVDGRFPGRAAPLPLLADEERLALNQAAGAALFRLAVVDGGARLPVRLAEDRLLLALALGAAPRVTLSRARCDAAGRELLPSPFLDGLRRAALGFEERHLPREPVPSLAALWSEADLRACAALEALCPPSSRQTRARGVGAAVRAALGAEPWLAHAAELSAQEQERVAFFSDDARPAGPASGQLPEALLGRLEEALAFDALHPLSASQLRAFGACAFQGLARAVLRLDATRVAAEEADERTKGTLLHAALAELVPELERRGWLGAAAVPEDEVAALVEGAVAAAATRLEALEPTGHPALWGLGQDRAARELGRLLGDVSLARPFERLRVEATEVGFGVPERSPPELAEVRLPAALPGEREVFLRGSIDRLDLDAQAVGVLDYKSGKVLASQAHQALLVTDFQLPLYLHAARLRYPGRSLQAAWLAIRGREVLSLEAILLRREGTVEELLATDADTRTRLEAQGRPNLANALHGLLGRLRQGRFGARPSLECGSCELQRVCRITARRLGQEG
jgi:ATP-dependent helicase/nuclease subunit B